MGTHDSQLWPAALLYNERSIYNQEDALINLLSNAHRHTLSGTRVVVSGWVAGDEVRLIVFG
jgi:K+-sensing histidine kinase KdpD